jgi:hypothetical protein
MMTMPILSAGPKAEGSTTAVEAVWGKRRLVFDRELPHRQRQRRIEEIGRQQIANLPALSYMNSAEIEKVASIIGAAVMRHREAERAAYRNGGAR